jgi:hypothetical protein
LTRQKATKDLPVGPSCRSIHLEEDLLGGVIDERAVEDDVLELGVRELEPHPLVVARLLA